MGTLNETLNRHTRGKILLSTINVVIIGRTPEGMTLSDAKKMLIRRT
ncbi:hypothetical protein [Alkalibacterium subtropicum]|nr:hypothetical protein [Alkalibacterium subtropicum]